MPLSRPRLLSLLLFALALAPAPAAGAQETSPLPDSVLYGDVAEAGRAAGRRLAERPGVLGYAAGGFVGGLPVGMFSLFTIGSRRGEFVAPTVAGVALVTGTTIHGGRAVVLPPREERGLEGRSEEYGQAFRDAYSERLRGRRRSAAVLGGVAGTVTGFVLLLNALRGSD